MFTNIAPELTSASCRLFPLSAFSGVGYAADGGRAIVCATSRGAGAVGFVGSIAMLCSTGVFDGRLVSIDAVGAPCLGVEGAWSSMECGELVVGVGDGALTCAPFPAMAASGEIVTACDRNCLVL